MSTFDNLKKKVTNYLQSGGGDDVQDYLEKTKKRTKSKQGKVAIDLLSDFVEDISDDKKKKKSKNSSKSKKTSKSKKDTSAIDLISDIVKDVSKDKKSKKKKDDVEVIKRSKK